MPGKRSTGPTRAKVMLPRPSRPPVLPVAPARPPKGGTGGIDLIGTLKGAGVAVVDAAKQQASDAWWATTHPKDRLLGRGRAQGTPMTIKGHTVYYQPSEFAAGPGGAAKALLSARAAAASRSFQRLAEAGARDIPLRPATVQALAGTVGKVRGVTHGVIDPAERMGVETAGFLGHQRQPFLVKPNGQIVVGERGTHHFMFSKGDEYLNGGGAVQGEFWHPGALPGMEAVEPKMNVVGWGGARPTKRQLAAINRWLTQAEREGMRSARKTRRIGAPGK